MRNNIIVEKLLTYTEKLLQYCDGLDYEQFSSDTKLVEACVFNLSQMGELANRVDDDFAQAQTVLWALIAESGKIPRF